MKISKNRDTVLQMKEQWLQQYYYRLVIVKPLYLFVSERKGLKLIFKTKGELSQNRTEKQIMTLKTTVNRLFNNM